MQNKRGIVRIIEAAVAIFILLAFVSFIALGNVQRPSPSDDAYRISHQVLSEISNNYTLRNEILAGNFLKTQNYVEKRLVLFPYLFSVSVCSVEETCLCVNCPGNVEIYANDVLITTNLSDYIPKRLSIFMWIPPGAAGARAPSGCVSECAAGQTGCEGNSYWTCGNFDTSDSCLEKSALTACSGATPVCSAGVCVAACSDECTVNTKGCNIDTITPWACTSSSGCLKKISQAACSGTTPKCSAGNCVQCLAKTDCTADGYIGNNKCGADLTKIYRDWQTFLCTSGICSSSTSLQVVSSCTGSQKCSNGVCASTPPSCTAQYICTESKIRKYQNADCTLGSAESAPACTKQSGVCSGSTKNCASGAWVDCSDADYKVWSANYATSESGLLCQDGLDNDCDGGVDKGTTSAPADCNCLNIAGCK